MGDLKGRNVGVTGLGSSTDFLTEYLLKQAGLKISDVTPVPVGAGDTLIAAMRHDQIQAAMTTEPTVSRLLETGQARILVDLRSLEGTEGGARRPLPCGLPLHADVLGRRARGHRPEAGQRLRADLALHRTTIRPWRSPTTCPATTMSATRPCMCGRCAKGKAMFTRDGRMPDGGPENVLRVMSEIKSTVRDRSIDLDRTYTTTFVDKANAKR